MSVFNPEIGCTITVKDYSFSIEDGNESVELLHNINFAARPGELLAVLGPSGCGKTTLLNCMSRRTHGKEKGDILFNGRDMNRVQLLNEALLAYVMSKDKHLEFLTVEEILKFAAKLKLNVSSAERINRIESLIVAMDLTSCRKTLAGGTWSKGLSTGEMRRLSIAVELLDNPAVVLMDEPTTGLDSTRAASLIPVLKSLAVESRKNIIMTIHQPSSDVFANFDRILIMSKGRIIFAGPADASMSYVNSRFLSLGKLPMEKPCNPADFLLDLVSAVPDSKKIDPNDTRIRLTESELNEWAHYYASSSIVKQANDLQDLQAKDPMQLVGLRPAGLNRWFKAFGVLYCRISLNSIRNPMETVILAGSQIILTTWLGMIFFQSCGEPDTYHFSDTARYYGDLFGFAVGDHPIVGAAKDASSWEAHLPDGSEPTAATPLADLLNDTVILGEEYEYVDYGTGILPDPDAKKSVTTPDIDYLFDDFPITVPASLDEGLEFTECLRDRLMAIPNLNYDELFSTLRYTNWTFNDIPDDIKSDLYNPEEMEEVRKGMQIAYRAVSLIDFSWNHISWDDLPDYSLYDSDGNLDPWIRTATGTTEANSPLFVGVPFWLKVMACYRDELNALLGCMNFPKLPILRDNPLIGLLMDVSCIKPQTKDSLKYIFARRLDSLEGFRPYSELVDAHNLRRLDPDFSNPNYSQDVSEWFGKFLSIEEQCSNDTCKAMNDIKSELAGDVGGIMTPVFDMLHIAGLMMFLAAFIQFASFDSILTFQQERVIFNRETNNQMYPISAYFLAKNCAALPFQYFHTIIGFCVLYFLSGIETARFFEFLLMAVATIWAMYGFNFFFSACSKTLEMAIYMVPAMVVTMLVTSGFFVRESTFPACIDWMKYFSCTRWGFHGFSLIYFPRGGMWGGLPSELALLMIGVTTPDVQTCYLALGMMGLLYRILAFFVLRFFHRGVGLES
eukprot:GHVH01011123.1.p1 GENE.GHVH01011123.1~~GHVH01011123.1.p1  ORF type:complete len:958 (+),score=105.88 GHVH01011123.1:49-2922(+)